MSNLSVSHPHNLAHDEAHQLAQKLADKLAEKYGLNGEWSGNQLSFNGPGVKGDIDVNENSIDISADLSFMWLPMRGMIDNEIQRVLNEHFE